MPLTDVSRQNDSTTNLLNGSTLPINATPIRLNRNDQGQYIRAKLRYFFMSPCWKWHLKRRCPWKAWFQILKIIVLTIQLILFGIERETHILFTSETDTTFHHLFLRGWDASWETLPYPRASGDFALYTYDDMTDSINYVVNQFNQLRNISFGLYDFDDMLNSTSNYWKENITSHSIRFCMNRFKQCIIDPSQRQYTLNIDTEDVCFLINATDNFDIHDYLLDVYNETIDYCSLNELTMKFIVHAVQIKNQRPISLPDCYDFLVQIIFDNNPRTGKIRQHLDTDAEFKQCLGKIVNSESAWPFIGRDVLIGFDCIIVLITLTSLILCLRSVWQDHCLCREVRAYFAREKAGEPPLTWKDLHIFYSFWYILMIITDILVIPGSALKIAILFKDVDKYETAGILIGLGSFLAWICILRYLSFFRKYNILFLTLKKSLPMVLRFVSCAMIIYCGYMFSGWIILGPYHAKFRTLSSTSAALFSLINGDDMYATFANTETESTYVWLFSEIYFYSFIALFIYVVVNLLITLLGDGYETVKIYFKNGFPKNRLQKFSEEDLDGINDDRGIEESNMGVEASLACFPCLRRRDAHNNRWATRDPYLMFHIESFS